MYLSAQMLDVVLKEKESHKLHCQAEAMCKFDCCRPMNLLYVDPDIVHHLILQQWFSIAVIGIYPIDIVSVI